jgi:putative ABC transport system ATP-binding protein
MDDTVIELKGIRKTYVMGTEDVHALAGVDLSISRGDFVAITGPSGSGKSTLMHIMGLLDVPTEGAYLLEGSDVSRISRNQQASIRSKKIGFVFQQFTLLPKTNVLDNVLLPTVYGDIKKPVERAKELLERVGLSDRAHHLSNQLSGGQIQRVAVARALMMQPAVILADEPTGNLDKSSSLDIMRLFRGINAQGATVVLITHEPEMAAFARRVVALEDGAITGEEGKPEQ